MTKQISKSELRNEMHEALLEIEETRGIALSQLQKGVLTEHAYKGAERILTESKDLIKSLPGYADLREWYIDQIGMEFAFRYGGHERSY